MRKIVANKFETKHTPGPWTVGANIDNEIPINAETWDQLAVVFDNDLSDKENAEAEANALLIAAAPELLEALESLWKSCIPAEQTVVGRIHLDHAAIIIAKARGGAA